MITAKLCCTKCPTSYSLKQVSVYWKFVISSNISSPLQLLVSSNHHTSVSVCFIHKYSDISQYFFFLDLFHLVWCHVITNGKISYFFLLLLITSFYVHKPHILYPFIHWQTFRLFSYPGYCEQCWWTRESEYLFYIFSVSFR